MEGAICFYL